MLRKSVAHTKPETHQAKQHSAEDGLLLRQCSEVGRRVGLIMLITIIMIMIMIIIIISSSIIIFILTILCINTVVLIITVVIWELGIRGSLRNLQIKPTP